MGPIINLRGLLLASMAVAAMLLAGASCQKECIPTQRTTPLSAPYNQFFSRLPTCGFPAPAPVLASSSTGLTDSFTGNCVATDRGFSESSSGCVTQLNERRSSYQHASLYGFSLSTQIEQMPAGPQLKVRDQSANSGIASTEVTYDFQSGQTGLKSYDTSFSPSVFGQVPVVTELTNFASGGRTYAQVWRITNPLNAARGRATAATVFYIDRDYGLIRFEQRDGTAWALAL